MLLKLHQVKMKCLGVERKQDRKKQKTSDLNSREDKNHIHVFFFLMYTIISLSMVSGFPCGVFIFQRVYLFPAFSAVLAEHTHTVCVLCRLCIVHCRTDVTTAGSSCESTCEAHVCVVFRYQFCMWRLCFRVWELRF